MEKHFTLDKTLKGNDHYHAMDPEDARKILKGIEFIDTLRGSYDLKCLDSEASARSNARRSIVTTCDIKKGAILTPEMLTYKRPGTGIPPEKMNEIIAEQLSTDAEGITEATSFKDDLGADSLDLFELVMALEDEYSVEIPAEDLQNLATVGDVMKYLKDKGVEE